MLRMRNIIAIAIWAWIPFCWQPLWGQSPGVGVKHPSHEKHQDALRTADPKDRQDAAQDAPIVVNMDGYPKSKAEAAEERAENNRKKWIDIGTVAGALLAALFTGVLVIVGWCGVRAAIRTLKAIQRQAHLMQGQLGEMRESVKAAKDSAAAALCSAQAVINSERPWIAIRVESPAVNSFVFRAVNVGRTPANVTAIWTIPVRIPRGSGNVPLPDAFSSEPPESVVDFAPCFLPPTADCVVGRYSIGDLVGNETEEVLLRWVNEGFAMIYFYGRIVYYDTLEPTLRRETRFYYRHLSFDSSLPIPDPDCPERNTYK